MGHKERLFYEIEDNWENFTYTPVIAEKMQTISEMIPPSVNEILDLACGNGLITNRLTDRFNVTGLDWSWPALQYISARRICASAAALPLKSRKFDLILCSELLEHLSEDNFEVTLQEIQRLAARYILISIPNNENIHVNDVLCPSCQLTFNASHHYRSFTLETLANCLSRYQIRESRTGGPGVRAYPLILLRLRQRLGSRWFQVPSSRTVICPRCENTTFPSSAYNPISFICDGINRLVSRRHPYWLYALFEIDRQL